MLFCLFSFPEVAWGQDAQPTPEELEEIRAAVGKDAAPPAPQAPPPAVAQAPTAPFPWSNLGSGLDLSFILDVALAAFNAQEPMQTGAHDPRSNGFTLQQLELSVGTVVDPYFRFDANIVLGQFGVEIEEAYVTSLDLPGSLQLRAGQFLTRFGRINNTHPHSWDFVDQPFALGRVFGAEGNRGLGVELSWLTPLPWYVEVLGSATDPRGEATARSFLGADPDGIVSPWDFQFTSAVKQFFPFTDSLSLLWGLSAAAGPNPTGYRNFTNVYGTDLYLKLRPVEGGSFFALGWQSELFYRRRQVPGALLQDVGAYSQVVCRWAQRWTTALRYEVGSAASGLNALTPLDPLDPEWVQARQRLSLNATFLPSEFSRLRFQVASDRAAWLSATGFSAFLALEVVTGAHGAHPF